MAKNKTVKVPVVMQLEALECGAACLCMIMAYHRKWIPLEKMRSDCGVSRDGSKAKNIVAAARSYGMNADGYRVEPDFLREEGEFPCIIHWNFNHFVVLDGFGRDCAILNDPARGRVKVSMEEFDRSFTGICLMFEPSESFVRDGKKRSVLSFVRERMSGTASAVAFAILTAVTTSLMEVISPGFSRVFIDRLLSGTNTGWTRGRLIFLIVL